LNRSFPTKAAAIWRQLDDRGHKRLMEEYLREASNFENARSLDRSPRKMFFDPLYAVLSPVPSTRYRREHRPCKLRQR
jgi:hypothetical protein